MVVVLLNIADMTPMHGFICCLSGRLTRSLDTDCSRMGLSCVEAPLGAIVPDSVDRVLWIRDGMDGWMVR